MSSTRPDPTAPPIASAFNDGYIAEVYEAWRRDPQSVDESWRQFFRLAQTFSGTAAPAPAPAHDAAFLRKVAGAAAYLDAIRYYGHLAVQIDPLGSPPPGATELTPEFYGVSDTDLAEVPAGPLGFTQETAADVARWLRSLYSSSLGAEYEHLTEEEERIWFRRTFEANELRRTLTVEEKRDVLRRLSEVDGLERFLGRAYQGNKRFSIEGTDVLVPMLDATIEGVAEAGGHEVIIGMAHRGRLNVLTHVMGKPYAELFAEFEGKHITGDDGDTGDVKYHLGLRAKRVMAGGRVVELVLAPNPSHLEFVNPVINGLARAHQRAGGDANSRDAAGVLTVCVHGDASFAGEGVVAETFNMSRLRGYKVGGTLHIIVNNQVGFTTDPSDARSTFFASDLAKGFEVPIIHVNADDPEACIASIRLGIAYRRRFAKDVLIDLVGYRRHGHNETDEPSFTQPRLYARIKEHPTVRELWGRRLVAEGVATADDVAAAEREVARKLEGTLDEVKASLAKTGEHHGDESEDGPPAPPPADIDTAVRSEQLAALNERLLTWPESLHVHPTLAKTLARRRESLESGIDWGHAEALAFATLLIEGTSVRMSGQDAERGTFSHRQSVLHDMANGGIYVPLQHLPQAKGTFEVYNSPLSETAVMGFEYGYSTAADDTLVLWEAQFGDFANVAAPIVDQFLASDRAKWRQDSGLVLLLPHGYEGQGPEHSSARLERFLQLCAEGNMRVVYPSTPAQYFHVLRRQAKLHDRRPLVLMQPKSLLRLKAAASTLTDLSAGMFRAVFDDAIPAAKRDDVRRLVFCNGKVYYDIVAQPRVPHVAVVRVEELYPWAHDDVARIVDSYPAIDEVVWAQEEPKNMGSWSYAAPRLRASTGNAMVIRYVGRPERASPAEGYLSAHQAEQARIVAEVLEVPKMAGRRKSVAGKGTG